MHVAAPRLAYGFSSGVSPRRMAGLGNRDNMKACPVHAELTQRPGGYPYLPPLLQDILERTGTVEDQESEKGYGPN